MASYRFVSRCRSLSQVFRRQLLCSVRPITIARSSGRLSRRGLSSLPRLRDQEAAVQQVSQSSKAPSRPRLATDKSAEPSPQSNAELLKFRSPPMTLTFTGGATIPVTTTLKIVTPGEDIPRGIWPVFRLMDEDGEFREPKLDGTERTLPFAPAFEKEEAGSEGSLDAFRDFLCKTHPHHKVEFQKNRLLEHSKTPYQDTENRHTLLRAHRQIIRLREMDTILMNVQRQGRISFYMTCRGEEAIHMGAASAMDPQDPVLAQYREQGLLMWRGFTLEQFTNQCFSTDLDLGRGRQMPVHYGSRALQYHTVSSPLGTQLPQAVGVAYRLKLAGKPNVPICFFGEGCASTTDFHSAMNFAATLNSPVVFFCRNNGYAISTPATDQYAGDGVVARAPGYGMAAIRVDGNDVFAVHAAVREARTYALEHKAPVLIEAMTYRLGHHSTSDDSTRYRSATEVEDFGNQMDPLVRIQKFLLKHGLATRSEMDRIQEDERFAVLQAMEKAEKRPPPSLDQLFEDVYHEVPPHLQRQKDSLAEHMAKYPKRYNT